MPKTRPLPGDRALRIRMAALGAKRRARWMQRLDPAELDAIDEGWGLWGHDGQHAPADDWRTWVILAGRGFGKTRAGAEWVKAVAETIPNARIALVAATLEEARRVMIDGASGLLAVAGEMVESFQPSLRLLRFANGAEATLFSGASPEQLRGPEHHAAWCDELAKWRCAGETWDMLQMGLRLGDRPQAVVTTTPRPGPVLAGIMAAKGSVVTGGPTKANPHLPDAFVEAMQDQYAGTRLGRQELNGELLPDVEGALWSVDLIERCRLILPGRGRGTAGTAVEGAQSPAPAPGPLHHAAHVFGRDRVPRTPSSTAGGSRKPEHPPRPGEDQENSARPERRPQAVVEGRMLPGPLKTIIGVDPPASAGTCGIVAAARDADGIAHILADHSVTGRAPEGWARAVAAAADVHGATLVVAERNQGGEMVRAVLRAAGIKLPIRLVHASEGKSARAEPIHALFEAGRVRLHGRFPALEAELCGFIAGGGYQRPAWPGPGGPGLSPDRADAAVWALTELMLGQERAEPRVVGF